MQKITVSRWTSPWERDVYEVESFKFPGGELQVRIPGLPRDLGHVQVVARVQSSDDLIQLLLVDQILARQTRTNGYHLIVPYFPYARQDRMTERTEAFSLCPIACVINRLNNNSITIVDPHSDVTPALLDNVHVIHQDEVMTKIEPLVRFMRGENPVVVAPDAGAAKKAFKASHRFGLDLVTASKVRDTATGEITGTSVEGNLVAGRHVLIVDDICDGGRTFIELAKELRIYRPSSISLYVTHGVFSKGLDVFDGLIERIFTTDSFRRDTADDGRYAISTHTLGFNAQGELA